MIGALLVLALAVNASPVSHQEVQEPRLVVVISVDQMRADYLTRFGEQFSGGLSRLVREGAVFSDAHQDHAITHTAPGHATISTGVFPSRNGIVSNEWWDRTVNRRMYAVEDPDQAIVGDSVAPGRSPENLLRDTLGDWLKQQSSGSKVFSVAIKDRSAILMGGKRPDAVYWYDYESGKMVTSEYYRDAYPAWVTEFNAAGMVNSWLQSGWQRLLPSDAYYLSREDAFAAEADGVATVFPHTLNGDVPNVSYYRRLPSTPFGDQLVLEFAKTLVTNEQVGADDVVDLLFVGASAADLIGHSFGPYSHEVQDYYVRLDGMLEQFLSFLDERVGTGRYTVVFTADHGVLAMPEELARRGVDSRRVGSAELQTAIVPGLQELISDAGISEAPSLQWIAGFVLYFPTTRVSNDKMVAMRRSMADTAASAPFVRAVFTYDELAAGDSQRPFYELFHRSFHPDRAPDLALLTQEHYLISSSPRGTSHGSPFGYDTHIPLIFWGPNTVTGKHDARVRSVDIAPTVAALLGLTAPTDLDGRSLEWAVRGKGGS